MEVLFIDLVSTLSILRFVQSLDAVPQVESIKVLDTETQDIAVLFLY